MNENGETGQSLIRYLDVPMQRAAPQLGYFEPTPEGPSAETGLQEIWRLLWQRRIQIAAATVLGLALGYGSAMITPAKYEAHTVLEVEGLNDNYLNLRDLAPTAPASPYGAEAYLQTQTKILKSESLARRVAQKLRLAERAEFSGTNENGLLNAFRRQTPAQSSSAREQEDRILHALLLNLNTRTSMQSRMIEVSFESTQPDLAAEVANAFAEQYIAQSLETRSRAMQRTMEWLTNAIAGLKVKLESENKNVEQFTRSAGLIITGDNANLAESRLRELQTEISRAQAERAIKQAQYETALASPIESATQVVDNGTLRDYQVNLGNLRRQLAELSASLTPAHYKVQKVQAQITELESAVANERQDTMRRIAGQYDAARRREDLLLKAYAGQAGVVANQSVTAARYGVMKREIQTAQQLYDSMLQKSLEASVATALTSSNVRVVDPALVPVKPFSPKAELNGAIGLMGGFIFGIAFAIVRSRSDKTLKEPGDMPNLFNLPELGVIPSAAADSVFGIIRKRLTGTGSASPDSVELATWRDGLSDIGDSFRSTLASILFSMPPSSQSTVLVVTSLMSGEGKTTVLSNLGIAFAETNRRTLLVDGDLRRPRLHKIFGLPNTWGLSDLLTGDESIDNLPMKAFTKATDVPGLSLLASGPGIANATGLFHSKRMLALLNRLRKDFDVILIDSPPMLQFPDSRLLGRMADHLVLVVRASRTTGEQMQFASARLMADQIPVLGAILNDWRPTDAGNGYYGLKYTDSGQLNMRQP